MHNLPVFISEKKTQHLENHITSLGIFFGRNIYSPPPGSRPRRHFLEMYAPEGDVDEDRSDPEDDTRTISRTAMKRSLQTKT